MIKRLRENFGDQRYLTPENQEYFMTNKPLNYHAASSLCPGYLKIHQLCQDIIKDILESEFNLIKLYKFIAMSGKCYMFDAFVFLCLVHSQEEICYQPMDHPKWQRFMENYELVKSADPAQAYESFKEFASFTQTGMVAINKNFMIEG